MTSPVEMTNSFVSGTLRLYGQMRLNPPTPWFAVGKGPKVLTNLSSRSERSVVERSAGPIAGKVDKLLQWKST
jgi:hypothetical protein